jgi:hypothetical protein
MHKHNVKIGTTYIVKVSGTLAKVRLTREHDRGGWYGTNLATGREIRIRTAARLRAEATPVGDRRPKQSRNPRYPDFSADELHRVVERAKAKILADVASRTVPSTCTSFSELHDYTDANGYGGAFERPFDNNETDFWNAVQAAVDQWIKQGGLKGPLTDEEARRIVDEIEL